MPALGYRNDTGESIRLGRRLGEGGEGAVYVVEESSSVAKLYTSAPSAEKIQKLQAMTFLARAEPAIVNYAAWPQSLVLDGQKVVGFTMPRLDAHHPIHELFGMKRRQAFFPQSNWTFLVHASKNLAIAFETLHARDIVVGDVNANNIMVQQKAIMRFIDCDSFQVKSAARTYLCEVGVPEYQPKEMLGLKDVSRVRRTKQQDAFGLAAMVFQLLFVGRHPFAGIPPANVTQCGISDNILADRYFYARDAKTKGLQPPPNAVPLSIATPSVSALFERAFLGYPENRPTATEWKLALAEMETALVRCTVNPAHRHLQGKTCPWCVLEAGAGLFYFILPVTTKAGEVDQSIWAMFSDAHVEQLWREISAVRPPVVPQAQITPSITPAPSPLPQELVNARSNWYVMTGIILAVGVGLCFYSPAIGGFALFVSLIVILAMRPSGRAEAASRAAAVAAAQREHDAALSQYSAFGSGNRFQKVLSELRTLRQNLLDQRKVYERELHQYELQREKLQLEAFLDKFDIADVKIKGLGIKRRALLLSFGIETAADVISWKLSAVPRLPADVQSELISWRNRMERKFRFDPSKGVDPKVLQEHKLKHVRIRTEYRQRFQAGPALLQALAKEVEAKLPVALRRVQAATDQLAQAKVNAAPLPWPFAK